MLLRLRMILSPQSAVGHRIDSIKSPVELKFSLIDSNGENPNEAQAKAA